MYWYFATKASALNLRCMEKENYQKMELCIEESLMRTINMVKEDNMMKTRKDIVKESGFKGKNKGNLFIKEKELNLWKNIIAIKENDYFSYERISI